MAISHKSNSFTSDTQPISNYGSTRFYTNNSQNYNFYMYKGFPYTYISGQFSDNVGSSYYCTDIYNRNGSVYFCYDYWNDICRQTCFNYYDSQQTYNPDEQQYEDIDWAYPTFVKPGTRPTFTKKIYSNIVGNPYSGGNYDVSYVTITRSDEELHIVYGKRDNSSVFDVYKYASDFQDNEIPKKIIVEVQAAGGGGGKGSTGIGGHSGNGGAGGGYVCCVLDIENVYDWRIEVGAKGEGGKSQGKVGGDASNTEIQYRTYWNSSYTTAIVVQGGKGATTAGDKNQAQGGYYERKDSAHNWILKAEKGGNGGSENDGGTASDGTSEINVRCTELSNSTDRPICEKRGGYHGGQRNMGDGGGASYFYYGGYGNQGYSGFYDVGDEVGPSSGEYGSGGGGSGYYFREVDINGASGGEAVVQIWY